MSARIRLQRRGKKKQPVYRIVVTDRSSGSSAGYISSLGQYKPEASGEERELRIDRDQAFEWLENGAQPSGTVRDLFRRHGILEAFEERKQTAQ